VNMAIEFLGAAQNVTGSRYLLECNDSRILVDCGLYQERDFRERNWDPFPVEPGTIDSLLLTHAHVDHCGYVPKLVRDGFQGNIFCTPATSEIARIVLLDAAHLQVEDAEFKRKRHEREGRKGQYPEIPLYTEEDATASLPFFSPRDYRESVDIGNGVEAEFHEAGHILGSSMIRLKVRTDSEERTILFSGDIGRWNKPILKDPTVFDLADYVIVESTYGGRLHDDTAGIDDLLEDAIISTIRRGGNVVIPSFAIGRVQEVLYRLNSLLIEKRIPQVDVYIDSPMAIRVTEVFKHHRELFDEEMTDLVNDGHSPFNFPGLKMASSIEDSKAINYVRKGAIIIAGSGMCTGGRIKHHLVSNIPRPESTVLFVGYQAVGTLGREIVEGAKQVRIHGQHYPVRAKIAQIHGFSAHADRGELLKWLSSLESPPKHVFVTHGEPDASAKFADLLKEKMGWHVSVPHYKQRQVLPG
jgi:metallo-beta-lactamase family protein